MRNSRIFHLFCLFLLLVLLPSTHALRSKSTRVFEPSTKDFFKVEDASAEPLLVEFLKVPNAKTSEASTAYKGVTEAFGGWLRYVVKAEFVPQDEFINQQIRLYKAGAGPRDRDEACLAYRVDQTDFLVIQTGGSGGRFMLFISNGQFSLPSADSALAAYSRNTLAAYLQPKVLERIPALEAKKKSQIIKMQCQQREDILVFAIEGQLCLSARKDSLYDSLVPSEPMPNRWFDVEETKSLQRGKK